MASLRGSVKDGQVTIRIAVNAHLRLDMTAIAVRRNLRRPVVKAHTVIIAHGALEALAQDVIKITADPGYESAACLSGGLHEFGIECRRYTFLR